MSSNFSVKKLCQQCGKQFYAKTTVTRFCSQYCAGKAYKNCQREKKIKKAEVKTETELQAPVEQLNFKDILNVKDAAKIFGCDPRTIYRLIENGRLKAINLSVRKIRIHRREVEKIFEIPELLVVPKSQPVIKNKPLTVEDCYHIKEVEQKFNISNKTLYSLLKRKKVPKLKEGKFIYVPKKTIDRLLKKYVEDRKDGKGNTKKKADR